MSVLAAIATCHACGHLFHMHWTASPSRKGNGPQRAAQAGQRQRKPHVPKPCEGEVRAGQSKVDGTDLWTNACECAGFLA